MAVKELRDAEPAARMTVHADGKTEFFGLRENEKPELAVQDGRHLCYLVTREENPFCDTIRAYAGRRGGMQEVPVRVHDAELDGMEVKEYHLSLCDVGATARKPQFETLDAYKDGDAGAIIRMPLFEAMDAFEPGDELILFKHSHMKTDLPFRVLVRPAPLEDAERR